MDAVERQTDAKLLPISGEKEKENFISACLTRKFVLRPIVSMTKRYGYCAASRRIYNLADTELDTGPLLLLGGATLQGTVPEGIRAADSDSGKKPATPFFRLSGPHFRMRVPGPARHRGETWPGAPESLARQTGRARTWRGIGVRPEANLKARWAKCRPLCEARGAGRWPAVSRQPLASPLTAAAPPGSVIQVQARSESSRQVGGGDSAERALYQ